MPQKNSTHTSKRAITKKRCSYCMKLDMRLFRKSKCRRLNPTGKIDSQQRRRLHERHLAPETTTLTLTDLETLHLPPYFWWAAKLRRSIKRQRRLCIGRWRAAGLVFCRDRGMRAWFLRHNSFYGRYWSFWGKNSTFRCANSALIRPNDFASIFGCY